MERIRGGWNVLLIVFSVAAIIMSVFGIVANFDTASKLISLEEKMAQNQLNLSKRVARLIELNSLYKSEITGDLNSLPNYPYLSGDIGRFPDSLIKALDGIR